MNPIKPRHLAILAALAASAIAAPGWAQPKEVSPLSVTADAPTSIAVSIQGKDAATVRRDVNAAASFVCRNAVKKGEMGSDERGWCVDDAAFRGMQDYARLRQHMAVAESGVIVVGSL